MWAFLREKTADFDFQVFRRFGTLTGNFLIVGSERLGYEFGYYGIYAAGLREESGSD